MESTELAARTICHHTGALLAWMDVGYACRQCLRAWGATEAEVTRRFREPLGVDRRRRRRGTRNIR